MKKIWYTGLRLPHELKNAPDPLHLPLIQVTPNEKEVQNTFQYLPGCTSIIFTSQTAVEIFFNYGMKIKKNTKVYAVGKKTASLLTEYSPQIPEEETAEGIVHLLEKTLNTDDFVLWPHSSLSRPVIADFLKENKISFFSPIFYETKNIRPDKPPLLSELDKVIFTSPSTVKGFFTLYRQIPKSLELIPIGPITKKALDSYL